MAALAIPQISAKAALPINVATLSSEISESNSIIIAMAEPFNDGAARVKIGREVKWKFDDGDVDCREATAKQRDVHILRKLDV